MKKIAFIIILLLLPLFVRASYRVEINYITYILDPTTRTAEVATCLNYNWYSLHVTIPKSVQYSDITYSVTAIHEGAFFNCDRLTAVTIPESVTEIGGDAFTGCEQLSDVYCYTESVPATADNAFRNVDLKSVTLHVLTTAMDGFKTTYPWSNFKTITKMTTNKDRIYYAFFDNHSVEVIGIDSLHTGAVNIPNAIEYLGVTYNVSSIGIEAFYGCNSFSTVEIPNSVTSIGSFAFKYCGSLKSINIPEGVTTIGDYAFSYCNELTSVTIGNNVTTIGTGAFLGCNKLTSVSIGNSVATIGDSAFSGCTLLRHIAIPNSVTSIGENAFSYSGLSGIDIGNSIPSISNSAFYNCKSLSAVNVSDLATWCKIPFNSIGSNPLYYAHHLYLDGKEIKDLVIPNNVMSIGMYTFCDCIGLESVTIPNSVTSIGKYAFLRCSNLTSVIIGSNVTTINDYAFSDCDKIKDVYCYATESVPSATNNTFENVNIQSANLHVQESAITKYKSTMPWSNFGNILSSGTEIVDTEINGIYYRFYYSIVNDENKAIVIANPFRYTGSVIIPQNVSFRGITYSISSIDESAFYGCSGLTSVNIPNSVTSIGKSAFYGCSGLTSVNIPNSVTTIGSYAFCDCSGLTSVNIPNSVTEIGDYTFHNCKMLTSVTIPNSVTSIGNYAFDNCSRLTSVTIPNNVTSIGFSAFYGCTSLTSVHISDIAAWCNISFSSTSSNPLNSAHHLYLNGEEITDLVIPNSVTTIGNYAFYGCSGLKSVTIPNSVTTIGNYAFYGCSGLTSVTIPNSVTTIGNYAFYGCSGLTSVTIPNSVTTIDEQAFSNCTQLSEVYCYAENVPSTGGDAFKNSNIQAATLFVLETAIDRYRNNEPWSQFGHIEVLILGKCDAPTIQYVNGKLTYSCATEGATFKSSITCEDIADYESDTVDLTVAYQISVYATAPSYENSEIATATLFWIDMEHLEGFVTESLEISAIPVIIKSFNNTITVEGLPNGTSVDFYTTEDMLLGSSNVINGKATINTSLTPGSIIVRVGNKTVKHVVR